MEGGNLSGGVDVGGETGVLGEAEHIEGVVIGGEGLHLHLHEPIMIVTAY